MDKTPLLPEPAMVTAALSRDGLHSKGVAISERAALAIYDIQARRGLAADVARLIEEKYSIELPEANRCVTRHSLLTCCAGPNHWLMIEFSGNDPGSLYDLKECLADKASVFDQSGAFTIIKAEGRFVPQALAKGIHLDLDPSVFGPGSAAVTSIAHIGVMFWKSDDRPSFEFAIPRSLVMGFVDWLHEASLEFGAP